MKIIYICSPLKGDIQNNINRAKAYCREIAMNGDIPIAPHIYLTQFLNDDIIEEREQGLKYGLELLKLCDEIRVYGTPSEGMRAEIDWWKKNKDSEVIYE